LKLSGNLDNAETRRGGDWAMAVPVANPPPDVISFGKCWLPIAFKGRFESTQNQCAEFLHAVAELLLAVLQQAIALLEFALASVKSFFSWHSAALR